MIEILQGEGGLSRTRAPDDQNASSVRKSSSKKFVQAFDAGGNSVQEECQELSGSRAYKNSSSKDGLDFSKLALRAFKPYLGRY